MMVPVPHTDSKPFSLQLSQSFHLLWYFGGCESLVKLASNGVRGWHKSSFLILSFLTLFPYFLLLESKGDQRQKTKRVKALPNPTSINLTHPWKNWATFECLRFWLSSHFVGANEIFNFEFYLENQVLCWTKYFLQIRYSSWLSNFKFLKLGLGTFLG